MKKEDRLGMFIVIGAILFLFVLCSGGQWMSWYRAGLQVEVYKREGIKMTQWEIFMGTKPGERTINIKDLP